MYRYKTSLIKNWDNIPLRWNFASGRACENPWQKLYRVFLRGSEILLSVSKTVAKFFLRCNFFFQKKQIRRIFEKHFAKMQSISGSRILIRRPMMLRLYSQITTIFQWRWSEKCNSLALIFHMALSQRDTAANAIETVAIFQELLCRLVSIFLEKILRPIE